MLCREWTLVHRAVDHVSAVPLKCNCWHCEYCKDGRRRELIARALGGNPNTFLTITLVHRPGEDPMAARATLARAWNMLVKRIKRHYRLKSLPFFAVVEKTKTGWPHLHVLARSRWISQKFISDCMADIADSPICDIRRIDAGGRAKAYVTKYVGKAPHQFGTFKRYWFSRDFNPGWSKRGQQHHSVKIRWEIERKPLMAIYLEFPPDAWSMTHDKGTWTWTRRC